MKKLKAIIILSLFCITSTTFGLDTNSIKYMPLQVGNSWVYRLQVHYYGGFVDTNYKITILSNSVRNNHLYFLLYTSYNGTNLGFFKVNGYFRVDSTTGSLYKYDSTNSCQYYYCEKLFDSLAANNGDSIKNCSSGTYRCTGTAPIIIFNDTTNRISFYDHYSAIKQ